MSMRLWESERDALLVGLSLRDLSFHGRLEGRRFSIEETKTMELGHALCGWNAHIILLLLNWLVSARRMIFVILQLRTKTRIERLLQGSTVSHIT